MNVWIYRLYVFLFFHREREREIERETEGERESHICICTYTHMYIVFIYINLLLGAFLQHRGPRVRPWTSGRTGLSGNIIGRPPRHPGAHAVHGLQSLEPRTKGVGDQEVVYTFWA